MEKIKKYFTSLRKLGLKDHIKLLRLGFTNYAEFLQVQEYITRTQNMLDSGKSLNSKNIANFLVMKPSLEEFSDIDLKAKRMAIRTYVCDRTSNRITMCIKVKNDYDRKWGTYFGQLDASEGDFFDKYYRDIAIYLAIAHKKYKLSVEEGNLQIQKEYKNNLKENFEDLEKRLTI